MLTLFNFLALFLAVVLSLVGVAQFLYSRFRSPVMPTQVGKWRVPGAFWIVLTFAVLVGIYLLVVLSRDPLAR